LLSWQWAVAGGWDSALATAERAKAIDTADWIVEYQLGWLYDRAGRREEADRAMSRFLLGGGELAQAVGNAAVYYQHTGNRPAVERLAAKLEEIARQRPFGVETARTQVCLALGDRDCALAALELAAENRERLLPMTLPQLAPLQNEPRFQVVKRKVFGQLPLPPIPDH
jgi:Flp pilus assembly protein TadD